MKPFNLEEAKNGAKICTRNGRSVTILAFNGLDNTFPIVAAVENDKNEKEVEVYTIEGKYYKMCESIYDLMLREGENTTTEKYKDYDFKPFQPVLVRDAISSKWSTSFFGFKERNMYNCCGCPWDYCIPYNKETEPLLGTNSDKL